MNVHVGWDLRRLYMNGTIAIIAAGGANSERRERRLMKDAMVAAGMWFVGERKMSRCRRKRLRCLLWRREGVKRL